MKTFVGSVVLTVLLASTPGCSTVPYKAEDEPPAGRTVAKDAGSAARSANRDELVLYSTSIEDDAPQDQGAADSVQAQPAESPRAGESTEAAPDSDGDAPEADGSGETRKTEKANPDEEPGDSSDRQPGEDVASDEEGSVDEEPADSAGGDDSAPKESTDAAETDAPADGEADEESGGSDTDAADSETGSGGQE